MATPRLLRIHKALAGLIAGLILVMAVIAGRATYGPWEIEIHGYLGNAVFVLILANVALAVRTRAPLPSFAMAVGLLVLSFAQTGLGYLGREELEAAAWHIPNGVLLMGLATFHYAELRTRIIDADSSEASARSAT